MSLTMSSPKIRSDLTMDYDGIGGDHFFIHFNSISECNKFKTENTNCIFGDICCSGKGVHLKSQDGIEINSYPQIHKIQLKYESS